MTPPRLHFPLAGPGFGPLAPRAESIGRGSDVFVRLCRARQVLCLVDGIHGPSVSEVARQAALSPHQFIRLFKALFGETPHQVRIAARLDKARRLLEASNRSVTQVCGDVGFSSLGTFSDLFARRVGCSPRRYRQKARVAGAGGTTETAPGCFSLMCGWPTR